MKLTVLVENQGNDHLSGEHGLSILIEYGGKKYLLDTGASARFATNAEKLKIDLSEVDTAILSHGHNDHSTGYEKFFQVNDKAKVYLRKAAKGHNCMKIGFIKLYVGMPKKSLEKYSERFVEVEGDYKLDEGVWLIPHKKADFSQRAKKTHMYQKVDGKYRLDLFDHEQSLVFEEEEGLVILNSCCHGGVDQIVKEVKETFPGKEVLAMIGGFHLMGVAGDKTIGVKAEEVRELGKALNELGVKKVYTCHCTGRPAYNILASVLGDRLHYANTGTEIEV